MLVELFTGLLFVIALLQLGLDWTLAEALMYISMFIVLVVTDLEIRVMPPNIVYPEIAIALLMAVINSFLMYQPGIISALVGLAFGMAFMAGLWVILRLSGKHSLSTGYFGMLGLIGVSTGFPLIIVALFVVVVIGGLSTLILMFFKKGKFYGNVPLALFFALGGTGAILWGKELLSVGANLMGR
jgi:prepilin signal peptidase PulO-like enzyme (type II secretory pathway)